MNKIYVLILIIGISTNFFLNSSTAQSNVSLSQVTILKQWNAKNLYSKYQTKWLEKNGFRTKEYNWSVLGVNLELEEGLKKREASIIWGVTSVILIPTVILYGAISAGLVISKSIKAKKAVLKAEILRLNYKSTFDKSLLEPKVNNEIVVNQRALKASETKWLIENNFDITDYSWQDREINMHLKKALNNRRSGRSFSGLGIAALIGSLYGNVVAASINHGDTKKAKALYLLPAVVFSISLTLKASSKQNLGMARKLKKVRSNSLKTK